MSLKKIILPALLLLSSVSYAQPKSEFGFAVGDNVSWYNGISSKPIIGIGLGLYSRLMIGKRISIDPRVYFLNYQGATGLNISLPSSYVKGSFDTTNVKRFNYYFTILAPVSYHLSPKIAFGIGPQFMIASGGTDQYKAVNKTDLLIIDNRNFIHQYDAGIAASFTYSRGLKLGLLYYYGLMYVVKDDNNHSKNSAVQLWVGIPFRNRKKPSVPDGSQF